MRILYFTNLPSPYNAAFYNELKKGNDLTVIFGATDNDKRDKRWNNNIEYSFKTVFVKAFEFRKIKQILDKDFDIYVIGSYATINGAFLSYYLKKHDKKFFISADGGFIKENDSFIEKNLKTYFISRATYYLSSGKETDKYLIHYGANKDSIFHVPFTSIYRNDILNNPIQYEEKLKERERRGFNYKRLFVSAGNFIYRKGYDLFLDAIETIKDENIGFIIIGSGKEKEHYLKIIEKKNLKNVHLIDFCNKQDLFDYFKISDVFFFPSRKDIWGLVINEAMACGLAIVSSNKVNAALELLDEEYLYNPYNLSDHRNKIEKMANLSNDELYEIGIKNIASIQNYTIENFTKIHNDIFKKVAHE